MEKVFDCIKLAAVVFLENGSGSSQGVTVSANYSWGGGGRKKITEQLSALFMSRFFKNAPLSTGINSVMLLKLFHACPNSIYS